MSDILPKEKKLVPISEAVEILGVSIDTVRRWDKAGILHSQRPNGKNRYFSLEELEKVKFSQPLYIGEVSERLGVSQSTLRRLEKKKLIAPERDKNGERIYTHKVLEKFLSRKSFLTQKEVQEKILEPLKEYQVSRDLLNKEETKEPKESKIKSKILSVITEKHEEISRLMLFRRGFYFSGLFLATVFVLIVLIIAIFFLIVPENTAELFGYRYGIPAQLEYEAQTHEQKIAVGKEPESGNSKILGETYSKNKKDWVASLIGRILKPFSRVSLNVVKLVSKETYKKVVPIEDVNDILAIDKNGNIIPLYAIKFLNSSYLKIPDKGLIKNLNADWLRGTFPGNGSIADNSITSGKILNNIITAGGLAGIITFGGTDLLDLSAINHSTTSKQGLILPNTSSASPSNPSSGEGYIAWDSSGNQIIIYDGSSWGTLAGNGDITGVTAGSGLTGGGDSGAVTLNIGGGSGITVNSDDIAVSLTTSGTTGSTQSNSGLEVSSSGLTLLKGCADGQLLEWTDAGGWACASDDNSGGSGSSNWRINLGGISPINDTLDLLIGSTASSSAKFAILNVNSGTPTASISASSGNNAVTLTGGGVLGTTNKQTLTLGDASTGEILIKPGDTLALTARGANLIGVGTLTGLTGLTSSGTITLSAFTGNNSVLYGTAGSGVLAGVTTSSSGQCLISGGSVPVWGSCSGAATNDLWDQLSGAIFPDITTQDLLLGATSTASAKFAFINVNSGTPTASLSAGASGGTSLTATGVLATTAKQTLTLGNSSTGEIKVGTDATGRIITIGNTTSGTGLTINANAASTWDIGNNTLSLQTINNGSITTGTGLTTLGGNLTVSGATITFGNSTPTLTTTSNNSLTLTSAGSGELTLTSDFDTGVNIGLSTNTSAPLSISGGIGSNASLIVNNINSGDLFTASASGSTKFTITNGGTASTSGNLVLDTIGSLQTTKAQTFTLGGSSTGEILINPGNSLGVLRLNLASSNGLFINGTAGATVTASCVNTTNGIVTSSIACPGGSGSNWDVVGGVITPKLTSTLDLLVGGTSTSSAKFAILNVNSGTPTASLSAGTGGGAFLTAQGALQTTAKQSLTLGGGNTGNIVLSGFGTGLIHSNSTGVLTSSAVDLATGDITGILPIANGGSFWNSSSGALYPGNLTLDLLIGATSSTSANFRVTGNTAFTGTTSVASVSARTSFAGLVVDNTGLGDLFTASKSGATKFTILNNGDIQFAGQTNFLTTLTSATANAVTLTIPDTGTTDTICLQTLANCGGAGGGSNWTLDTTNGVIFPNNGTVDLLIGGRASSSATFRVTGSAAFAGTTSSASISAKTSFAALVVDNRGVGDIFTASSSGLTRFVVRQSGVVLIGNNTDGLTFDYLNGGPTYAGAARPTKKIVLTAEYAGAVLTASGSATTNGTMTSDASSSATLAQYINYYEWTSSQTTLQDYTVAVRVQLPEDFGAWATATSAAQIKYNTELGNADTNKLDIIIYNASQGLTVAQQNTPVVYRQAGATISKNWTDIPIASALLDSGAANDLDAAGETMVIYLKMYSKGDSYTQVGDITLSYLSKF